MADTVTSKINTVYENIFPTQADKYLKDCSSSDVIANDVPLRQSQYFEQQKKNISDATFAKVRKYQIDDFSIRQNEFYITFTKYAMYLTSFMLVIMSLLIMGIIPSIIAYLLLFVVIVSYLFVFYLESKKNMIRRPYDYGKMYWEIQFKRDNEYIM
jgi:hypothetical protein